MFDVGFSEILVIMVVALLVLGPERLPQVARTLGRWWGGLQRYVNRIKADVSTSMELEELRQMERRIKAEAEALERSMNKTGQEISSEMRQIERAIEEQPLPGSQSASSDGQPPQPK